MPTFRIETLGCKVNQYESLQMQQLLSDLGWRETSCADADLVIVNTCAVTTSAAAKSRQLARKLAARAGRGAGQTVITGCWATGDRQAAQGLTGVTAVVGHGDDVAAVLRQLANSRSVGTDAGTAAAGPGPAMVAGVQADTDKGAGHTPLPLLSTRQSVNQRALLKVQDGCDAHCTYCIIPKLRPKLWSKPLTDAVDEARRLVVAGHLEIVLTGVFLGAYGQPTAQHRRQVPSNLSLARLIEALCTQVPGLQRLRLSSLEPADVTVDLIAVMRSHAQVMPHFHLPLQSGSDQILKRMNRQYSSGDYLTMIQHLRDAFDRPAFTTDIITGFPGETEDAFAQTQGVARQAGFIHIHAFPYSSRPGTAASRWKDGLIPQRVANERVRILDQLSAEQSLAYRQQFVGSVVNVLVERQAKSSSAETLRHGRSERYFMVHFSANESAIGKPTKPAEEVPLVMGEDSRLKSAPLAPFDSGADFSRLLSAGTPITVPPRIPITSPSNPLPASPKGEEQECAVDTLLTVDDAPVLREPEMQTGSCVHVRIDQVTRDRTLGTVVNP